MKEIKVLDNIMGTGKTNFAINLINSNKKNKYIYATPYLDELKRVQKATNDYNRLYEPKKAYGKNKTDSFIKFIKEGKNICTTHALLLGLDLKTIELLKDKGYILIIDESLQVLNSMDNLSCSDIDLLLASNMFYTEKNLLQCTELGLKHRGRYKDVIELVSNDNVLVSPSNSPFWCCPPRLFEVFSDIYVMTYMFNAQMLKYYFDLFNIGYSKYQLNANNDRLIPYTKEIAKAQVQELSNNIEILRDGINDIGEDEYSLSVGWYNRASEGQIKKLQNNVFNFFHNKVSAKYGIKTKATDRMWTTFMNYKDDLSGNGYASCFVPHNARATNKHANVTVMAYTCNKYFHPTYKNLFIQNDIPVYEDDYAVSELVQWIWRSGIRKGKKVYIYVPSIRMRNLVIEWLRGDFQEVPLNL